MKLKLKRLATIADCEHIIRELFKRPVYLIKTFHWNSFTLLMLSKWSSKKKYMVKKKCCWKNFHCQSVLYQLQLVSKWLQQTRTRTNVKSILLEIEIERFVFLLSCRYKLIHIYMKYQMTQNQIKSKDWECLACCCRCCCRLCIVFCVYKRNICKCD